jgi:excisionase family DNA binding protein
MDNCFRGCAFLLGPEYSEAQEGRMTDALPRFLTLVELAELSRVNPRTVRRMMKRGEITHIRMRGKLLFPGVDVVRYIEQRCVPAIRA